jgi:hypothetical protein
MKMKKGDNLLLNQVKCSVFLLDLTHRYLQLYLFMGAKQVDDLSLRILGQLKLGKVCNWLVLNCVIFSAGKPCFLSIFAFSDIFLFFTYFCVLNGQAGEASALSFEHLPLLAFGHEWLRNKF